MGGATALSVIVNTYKRPDALNVVLAALSEQSDSGFEILVAEDADDDATAEAVKRWAKRFHERIQHVRQNDAGYRRARIVNVAALSARGEYLAFLDGDSVPRVRFVESVRRAASIPGWFLASKRINLDPGFSARVLASELPIWRWSAATWMVRGRSQVRRPGFFISARDRRRPWHPEQPDFEPPDNGYGFFCAMSRASFERVNGWDARYVGWGNDDIDLAVRLRRSGLRCGWAGPESTLLHLWHPEGGDPDDPGFLANEQLVHETMASDRIEAIEGLRELAAQVTAKRATSSSASSEPA